MATATAIAFPPYHPEPLPSQNTDCGVFDMLFDADVRSLDRQATPADEDCMGDLPLAGVIHLRQGLSDDSKHRNHAWLAWRRAALAANRAGLHALVRQYAPTERAGYPAHERHIKACTTRLCRALSKYPGFSVNRSNPDA